MSSCALKRITVTFVLAVTNVAIGDQPNSNGPSTYTMNEPANPVDRVRLDPRLGDQVPLVITDRGFEGGARKGARNLSGLQGGREVVAVDDTSGDSIKLANLVDRRPVVLVPAYYRCPMLCTLVISALVDTVAEVELKPGADFQIVVFSIDPRETPSLASEKKLNYLRRFGRNDTQDGWHFLTAKQDAIEQITNALGYGYAYDPENDQFAHPAAIAVLTPDGQIARYLLGLDYQPRDLRLALVEASQGRIGDFVDQIVLRCYHYDPARGRYGFAIMSAIRIAGAMTVLALGGAVMIMRRRMRLRTLTIDRDETT